MFIYILDYGTFLGGGGGNVSNMSFLEKKFQDGH